MHPLRLCACLPSAASPCPPVTGEKRRALEKGMADKMAQQFPSSFFLPLDREQRCCALSSYTSCGSCCTLRCDHGLATVPVHSLCGAGGRVKSSITAPQTSGTCVFCQQRLGTKKCSVPNFCFEESLQTIPGTGGPSSPDPAPACPAGHQSHRFTFLCFC